MTRVPVARPDAIRRHNLGMLLGQIHRDGALTRAQLTQRLHLSRSTIGALVAELSELGLVDEQVPTGGDRAGRPSHVVGPRPGGPYAVAVDVDINTVTAAAVGIGGEVLARHVFTTNPAPARPAAVAAHVAEALDVLAAAVDPTAHPVGIGISVPGTVRANTGWVEFAPNLDWRHEPFGELVHELIPPNLPVTIGNDADLAVRAEQLRGNARDCTDVIYIMARIGVGAGIIVGGQILHGHHGLAGEVGHNVVDPSGPPCHCGKRGCVETFIGENAMLAMAGRALPATPDTVAELFADATGGDALAMKAVRAVADALGRTLANLANVLNPERVLLGGSLSSVLEIAGEDITHALDEYVLGGTDEALELLPPALGEDAMLLGAAELAFAALLDDPAGA